MWSGTSRQRNTLGAAPIFHRKIKSNTRGRIEKNKTLHTCFSLIILHLLLTLESIRKANLKDFSNFYCLSKTIAYGDGSSRRQLKHAVFFASAL
ncbi:MAG: hypothetical protein JW832_15005, partial [Deltaproteobacteria bacterium]|nr:hypothetical protein [Deltaproteobacteria bacterium]